MTNNDILRKLRYTFNYSDDKMISLFALGGLDVDKLQVRNWLKKEDDPGHKNIYDKQMAHFLNGFITEKRGKKEGPDPIAEKNINNNIILRKLKIALNLKVEDIVVLLQSVDIRVSKHEISAFFRKPGKGQYKTCGDQFLRNFLLALQFRYRAQ